MGSGNDGLLVFVLLSGFAVISLLILRAHRSELRRITALQQGQDPASVLREFSKSRKFEGFKWWTGLALASAGLLGPGLWNLLGPAERSLSMDGATTTGQADLRALLQKPELRKVLQNILFPKDDLLFRTFRGEDALVSADAYQYGGTIEPDLLLRSTNPLLELAMREGSREAIDAVKRVRFLVLAGHHPEIANTNYVVESTQQVLTIRGDARNKASADDTYEIRVGADRDWRTEPDSRLFMAKHILGGDPITEEQATKLISVWCGPEHDSMQPLDRSDFKVKLFGTKTHKGTSFVTTFEVPLSILEQGGGRAAVRIAVGPVEQLHPYTQYEFEAQRFRQGVHRLEFTVRSELKKDQARELKGQPPQAEEISLGGPVTLVRGDARFDADQDEWVYSFRIDHPSDLVLFSFGP